MVSIQTVDGQLEKVGMKNKFFGRPEVRELCYILVPDEIIQHAVIGRYEGGFALLVTTNKRILLIDKKPWFLTLEDIRYDMVSEVDYFARLLDATISLNLLNKKVNFTSWSQIRLRDMVHYIQHRVMNVHDSHQETPQSRFEEVAFSGNEQKVSRPSEDFANSFSFKRKQHSFAHHAGQVVVDIARRKTAIIKPLYPRPSLMSRYGRSDATARKYYLN